jgi:hypothetical protein
MLETVPSRVHRMRRPLCLLAIAVLLATWVIPASALAAIAAPPSGGGSLLEGLGGSGSSSSGGGATEEGEGEEGTGASKKTTGTGTGSSEESKGIGSLPIIFGMGGAAILITAIAVFILRDARRNAPVPGGALTNGSTRVSPAQARRRRAKAKSVKQQRKRNRPR